MKCIMCNAKFAKAEVSANGAKLCPKCCCIIGSIPKVSTPLSRSKQPYLDEMFYAKSSDTDRPKDKTGKYQPHLVLSSLTRAIARVREYGVRKYHGENGWKQQTAQDYMDAVGRHYDACRNDPLARDEESGLLHIAQLATDAMFILDMLKEQGVDLDTMKEPPCLK